MAIAAEGGKSDTSLLTTSEMTNMKRKRGFGIDFFLAENWLQ